MIGGLPLDGRGVAEGRVEPLVVVVVDPVAGGQLELVDGPEGAVHADAFGLVQADD